MNDLDQLFDTDPFLFSKENQSAFFTSFRAAAAMNFEKNSFFRGLWKRANKSPSEIYSDADLADVPWIMVNLFKEHELYTGNLGDIVLNLTSSGTSGQKSQIFLDQASLDRVKKLAYNIHKSLGMCSDDEVNYLCFTYDPKVADHLGTAFTDELLTSFTRKKSVYYAIQWDEGIKDFKLNIPGVVETLRRFSNEKSPVRILGFPAHLYKIIKDKNLRFNFGAKSWVQTGGGWKGFQNEEVPKEKFRSYIADALGIPVENVRDMFGMVEHGIPYCDCRLGKLHVPNYARVLIRDPEDWRVCQEGEVGLIQFFCSYLSSYPSLSLMTTDWGSLERCNCGIDGWVLNIKGRAGVSKHKGCALSASKLLDV